MLIPFLFFISGATALVYELIWSKYLSLIFGSTVYAQTAVLSTFMLGLALGSWLIGKLVTRTSSPLKLYGGLELLIGVYGFCFPMIYHSADQVFIHLGQAVYDQPNKLLLLKIILSVFLLIIPTLLMGGTLPAISHWLQTIHAQASQKSTWFYAINTLGAVTGTAFAGFLLIRHLGLGMTNWFAAVANCLVGLAAFGYGHYTAKLSPVPINSVEPMNEDSGTLPLLWSALIVALVGAVSMALEVLASRALSMVFGASIYAFATALLSFILGIGIGSLVVSRLKQSSIKFTLCLIIILLSVTVLIALWIGTIRESVLLYCKLDNFSRSEEGYLLHFIFTIITSVVVLGIPAALLGSVLPLCIRSTKKSRRSLSQVTGILLSWNTFGGVIGVVFMGFFFMPKMGIRGSLVLLGSLLGYSALLLAWITNRRTASLFGLFVCIGLLIIALTTGSQWQSTISSGIFRRGGMDWEKHLQTREKHHQILFFEDAADATVSIERGDGDGAFAHTWLRINGKPDASSEGDLSTQFLLAHIPLLSKPDAKDVFVLGFGSGITCGAALTHPIQSLTLAENCEPVLRAGKFFEEKNRSALKDPRMRVFYEDARTVLKLYPKQYDIIISEPSNPWTAGVGSVFSKEFYELAAERLGPNGLMVQWFHNYEMTDDLMALIIRTFQDTFPSFEVWDPQIGDLILVGSKTPWKSNPEVYKKNFFREETFNQLKLLGLKQPEYFWARQVASQETSYAIPGEGTVQTDESPILEYDAPKSFYFNRVSRWIEIFDERVFQTDLASPEKRRTFQRFDTEALQSTFYYSSLNHFLTRRLLLLKKDERKAMSENDALNLETLNCIFFKTRRMADIPPKASAHLKAFIEIERSLYKNPGSWREASDQVYARLILLKSDPMRLAIRSEYFTSLVIRPCIVHQDWERARKLLAIGLELDPTSPELRYFDRLCLKRWLNATENATESKSNPSHSPK
jgi:spermidine synthase